jgi:DNA polymerase I-like protein with 3'-5' exonuclease and polymerase domains
MRIEWNSIPFKRSKWWIKNFNAKMFDLNIPTIVTGEKGPKILLVIDKVPREDIPIKKLLGSNSNKILFNVLDYIKCPVSEIRIINLACFKVKILSESDEQRALKDFWDRTSSYIEDSNPDCVVLCGEDSIDLALKDIDENIRYLDIGRRFKAKINGKKYNVVPSLPYHRICSTVPDEMKKCSCLIGEFARHLETAINGNAYNIDSPYTNINVNTIKKFNKFMKKLRVAKRPCWDTEFMNLSFKCNKVLSIQCSLDGNTAYYIPMYHPKTPFTSKELEYIKKTLKKYFEFCEAPEFWMAHNSKAELGIFKFQLGVQYVRAPTYDSMLAESALDENRRYLRDIYGKSAYSLQSLTHKYGSHMYCEGVIRKDDRENMSKFSLKDNIEYACKDVISCWRVSHCQIEEAKKRNFKHFVRFVTGVLSDEVYDFFAMESNGCPVDKKYLVQMMSRTSDITQSIEKVKYKYKHSKNAQKANEILCKNAPGVGLFGLPWVFDIAKEKARQSLFFDIMKLKPLMENTKGGSTNKAFQTEYAVIPEVKWLTEYNKAVKVKSTFVKKHLDRLNEDLDAKVDGCIRSHYGIVDVLTGRASSRDPNLQQIPAHGPLAKPVKRQFVAYDGFIFIKIDYRAHEVDQWTNVSHDKKLTEAFHHGSGVRKEQRILDYKYNLEKPYLEWTLASGFDNAKTIADKRKLAKKVKDKRLRNYVTVHIDLLLYGDPHKINYHFFFGVPVELVTPDQRQNVKSVVFGVIYGKQSISLAYDIHRKDLEAIDRKVRNMSDDMDEESLEAWEKSKKRKYFRSAQDLIDKLFSTFKEGGDWLKDTIKVGQKTLQVVSPTGRIRHLWGYLNPNTSIHRSCDRRGPNSYIQGFASELAFIGGRLIQKTIWERFHKNGIPFSLVQMNAVHDSSEDMAKLEDLPESLYIIEHSMTTMLHHELKEKYGFEFDTQLEIEFEIGFSLGHMSKWDYTDQGLRDIMSEQVDWAKKELGRETSKETLAAMWKSWDKVKARRLKELEAKEGDVEYTIPKGMKDYIRDLRKAS